MADLIINPHTFGEDHILNELVSWFNALPVEDRTFAINDVPLFKVLLTVTEPGDPAIRVGDVEAGDTYVGEVTYIWAAAKGSNLVATNQSFFEVAKSIPDVSRDPITTDSVPEGTVNLYFTSDRVRATELAGMALGDINEVAPTDTVVSAVGKLATRLNTKQAALQSGQNIKTINGESVLGTGDISVQSRAIVEHHAGTSLVLTPATSVGKYIVLTNPGDVNVYVPGSSSTYPWQLNDEIHIRANGPTQVTIAPYLGVPDVTLNVPLNGSLVLKSGMTVTLKFIGPDSDTWDVIGYTDFAPDYTDPLASYVTQAEEQAAAAEASAVRAEQAAGLRMPVIPVTNSRSLALTDHGAYLRSTASSPITLTIEPQSTIDWPETAEIGVRVAGTGNVTIVAGSGVTINAPAGGSLVLSNRMNVMIKRGALNDWDIIGQTEPGA